MENKPRGRYFEEFELGLTAHSAGRTITESDVVAFAALSGDYNEIHTNVEFAKNGPFGQRVAHGLLVLSMATGLLLRLGFMEGTVQAFRELTCKFSLPVFIGDTIQASARTTAVKAYPRLGGGLVTFEIEVTNQRGQVVQRGEWIALVSSRPQPAG